jgi:hypothetical protein
MLFGRALSVQPAGEPVRVPASAQHCWSTSAHALWTAGRTPLTLAAAAQPQRSTKATAAQQQGMPNLDVLLACLADTNRDRLGVK